MFGIEIIDAGLLPAMFVALLVSATARSRRSGLAAIAILAAAVCLTWLL